MELSQNSSLEDIQKNIAAFKAHALTLAYKTISGKDAQLLEPREIKTLTDVVLNIEDTLDLEGSEGAQARKIQRLLDKYGDTDYTAPHTENTTNSNKVIEHEPGR